MQLAAMMQLSISCYCLFPIALAEMERYVSAVNSSGSCQTGKWGGFYPGGKATGTCSWG